MRQKGAARMNCTLQIFLSDRWVDCAEIGLGNLCQWNYLVMYAVEHADAAVSLATLPSSH